MCPPLIAAAGLAIALAGTAATVYGQEKQSRDTARYQNDSVHAANATATSDFQLKNAASQAGTIQGDTQANEKKTQNNLALAKAKATARLGAAEGGVEGNSVDALYADFDRQNGEYNSSVDANNTANRAQTSYANAGARSQGQSFLNGFNFAPIQGPDYFGAGANLAGAGMNVYDRYQINKKADANSKPNMVEF